MTQALEAPARTRAHIRERTLRKDRWWENPAVTGAGLAIIVIYLTFAVLVNRNYYWEPYISPLYSPCIPGNCVAGAGFNAIPWWAPLTPAILIIGGPMGFRMTCYYYRKAYYRAFYGAPPACAVREPHKKYTGETRLPLILQNLHRYFFWIGIGFNGFLTYDAVIAFQNHHGQWGHMGLGSLVLVVNAILLWGYSLSCHACRHITGGRLRNFSRHPVRYWMWTQVSRMNAYHMQWAWVSLFFVAFTDAYVRLVASGLIADPRFF